MENVVFPAIGGDGEGGKLFWVERVEKYFHPSRRQRRSIAVKVRLDPQRESCERVEASEEIDQVGTSMILGIPDNSEGGNLVRL